MPAPQSSPPTASTPGPVPAAAPLPVTAPPVVSSPRGTAATTPPDRAFEATVTRWLRELGGRARG